ncbi:hypothetical protein Vadar_025608 [Vaccinium darrowii]|uniref:Uncharacterized protein n=1 Tax=Vaccinium darrowii TaxID=229202 RepID=A0ACB7X4G2_9ERIC|nr:hypothetical protein Vadar_025608 [Vaccinium darrowii]
MQTVYTPRCYGLPEEGGDMVWLSHCLQLQAAPVYAEVEEVEVSFGITGDGQIKECGVHLLYSEEEGEVFQFASTIRKSWEPTLNFVI